jgi:cellulose synthase/poly-beta-1,6-N-acetylglucosamine synthase-like glycosyltransferase
MVELTIIIPTHNRREVMLGTLQSLSFPEAECEVVVVDDGSNDGTAAAVEAMANRLALPVVVERRVNGGAGAARNRGLEVAQGRVCLLLGDDIRPAPGTVQGHLEFHRRNPREEDALIGRVDWAAFPPPTPFMEWLEISGIQNGFGPIAELATDGVVPGRYFFGSNTSAKTGFLRANRGFDESFRPACEDIELGMRLERRGLRLTYDPGLMAQHLHPTDLPGALRRMRGAGASRALLRSRVGAAAEAPRPPGIRHRVGSAALTGAALMGIPNERLRRETWRFLCHEAHREGFWAVEAKREGSVRIGGTLARLARRDARTQMPS